LSVTKRKWHILYRSSNWTPDINERRAPIHKTGLAMRLQQLFDTLLTGSVRVIVMNRIDRGANPNLSRGSATYIVVKGNYCSGTCELFEQCLYLWIVMGLY
jgi:hypothetical protein